MPLLVALLLGAVQGVFMFVPVSSTSHLVLTQTWLRDLGVDMPAPDSPEMILFDLVVHVGTLVSVAIVMRGWLREVAAGVGDEWRTRAWRGTTDGGAPWTRLVVLGLVSVAVTGVLGLTFGDLLSSAFGAPRAVAAALVVTGALLWWTDVMTPERDGRVLRFGWRGPAQVTLMVAVAVGVAQAVALLPGVSRSGATIVVALLAGMTRELAARYSFTIAIPTILAATGVQALRVGLDEGFVTVGIGAMAVGFVTAAIVGTFALWAVLRLLEAARFRVFAFYVWGLATVVVVSGVGVAH